MLGRYHAREWWGIVVIEGESRVESGDWALAGGMRAGVGGAGHIILA